MELHSRTIRVHGGLDGVRDAGLLEAAVTMPRQQFGGAYLHDDLAAMAAAYLYHLAQNHAFHDGNKRVASLACLVFLDTNGAPLPAAAALERVTLAVAGGSMTKIELTDWLRGAIRA